jgi:hypothetical protein
MTLSIFGSVAVHQPGRAPLLATDLHRPAWRIPLYLLDFVLGRFCAARSTSTTGPGLKRPVSGAQTRGCWFAPGDCNSLLIWT